MLISVIVLFSNASQVLTSDKVMTLFGGCRAHDRPHAVDDGAPRAAVRAARQRHRRRGARVHGGAPCRGARREARCHARLPAEDFGAHGLGHGRLSLETAGP
ncbi:MAG: hypothetical protein ACLSVD_14815 [Eggerthellaceae bacterium]